MEFKPLTKFLDVVNGFFVPSDSKEDKKKKKKKRVK